MANMRDTVMFHQVKLSTKKLYGYIQYKFFIGIRAVVSAIYEPPQNSSRDSIKLLEDEHALEVDELAAALGLKKIGWIFTDLISEDPASGTVKHIRGIETHFLTAQECILAGQLQNQHPNVSKYSSNGFFGSKFVTICVTGKL